ncbi:MAG: glycosyltransferase family 39 protein [Candidatus Altiarchaeota archaeon]
MAGHNLKRDVVEFLPAVILANFALILAYIILYVNTRLISVDQLMWMLPLLLFVTLSGIIALFVINFDAIRRQFQPISRSTWTFLIIILLVGAYLRVFVAPHTHRIFFDEDIYMDVGNSIASEGRALLCNYGTPEKCVEGILNKEPNGYPVLVAALYLIFGRDEQSVFIFETLLGIATIAVVFLTAYLVFERDDTALYTALLFALMPSHIIWSTSVGAELISIFFILVTLLAFLIFFRAPTLRMQLLATLSAVYAIQVRPENGLLLGVMAVMFLVFDKKLTDRLKSPSFYIPWFVLALLITPHLIHLAYAARTDTWGASEGKLGLKYIDYNLPINTRFWYDNNMHPAFFTLLAIAGLVLLAVYDTRKFTFLLTWFLAYHILYIVFYSGSFTSGGIGTRFALIVSTPALFFGGYCISKVSDFAKEGYRRAITAVLVTLILISFYPLIGFIKSPDMQAQYAREKHDFVLSHIDEIDPSCYTLTHNPNIFLINGRSALQTWFGQNRRVMQDVYGKTDCVLFLEGAWCLWEPHKSGVCKYMKDNYNLTVMWRLVRENNPDQVFTIYKVSKPLNY